MNAIVEIHEMRSTALPGRAVMGMHVSYLTGSTKDGTLTRHTGVIQATEIQSAGDSGQYGFIRYIVQNDVNKEMHTVNASRVRLLTPEPKWVITYRVNEATIATHTREDDSELKAFLIDAAFTPDETEEIMSTGKATLITPGFLPEHYTLTMYMDLSAAETADVY